MNLGQRIRKGVKWLVVGSTAGHILEFGVGIVLARLLMPADFGMIATISVFTGFVGILASGGMGQSIIRAKEADTDDFNGVFTWQLGLGFLIYIAFFVAAPWIATYFENPLYADLLRVSAISFIIRPFSFIRSSWLSREMEFKKRTQAQLVAGFITGIASVSMAAGGLGVWSLTLGGLLGALVSNVMLACYTPLRPRLHLDTKILRKHGAYGFKITASEVLKHLRDQSINLILSKSAGPAFLGLYSKAESLARLPNRLVTPATSNVVFRAMSKVQDDLDQTKYMFHRTITLLMVYIFPSLVGLWWVAEPFVGIVYGEKWLPIVEPLRIIVVAGVFRTIFIPCGLVLEAQNRLTQQLGVEAFGLVFGVTACIVGLKWGLVGVSSALVLTTVASTICGYVLVHRTIPIRVTGLLTAATPALILNAILVVVLAGAHLLLEQSGKGNPVLYLAAMVAVGMLTYATAFLLLPIPALRTEVVRWKDGIGGLARIVLRRSK